MYITKKTYFQYTISDTWNGNVTATVVLLCSVNLNRLVHDGTFIPTFCIQREQFIIYRHLRDVCPLVDVKIFKSHHDKGGVLDINKDILNGSCFMDFWTGASEVCANSGSSTALLTNRTDSTRLCVCLYLSKKYCILYCPVWSATQAAAFCMGLHVLILPTDWSSFVRDNIATLCKALVLDVEFLGP
jgi:hypothetical protein